VGLYSSPNTVPVIKARRMISAGHIGSMGERGGVYRVLVGKPQRDHLEVAGVDGG